MDINQLIQKNRDQIDKCLALADTALKNGMPEHAQRLLNIAKECRNDLAILTDSLGELNDFIQKKIP